jgi:hypothetical protein
MEKLFYKCINKTVEEISSTLDDEDMVSSLNNMTPIFNSDGICVGIRTFTRNVDEHIFKVYDTFNSDIIQKEGLLVFAVPDALNERIASICYIIPDTEIYLKYRYDYPEMILQSQVEYYTDINPVPYQRMISVDYMPTWLSTKIGKLFDAKLVSYINKFILQGQLSKSKVVWRNREYIFKKFFQATDTEIKDTLSKKLKHLIELSEVSSVNNLTPLLDEVFYNHPSIVYGLLRDTQYTEIKQFLKPIDEIIAKEGLIAISKVSWNNKIHEWEIK